MKITWKPIATVVLATLLTMPIGCNSNARSPSQSGSQLAANPSEQGDEHEPEPANLAEGLEQLSEHCQEIKAAFEKDAPEDAHNALHEVGHLLEALPSLAEKSGKLATAEIDTLRQQVEVLFDAFGTLDETLHGGEAVVYSEIDSKIQTAMSALKEIAK